MKESKSAPREEKKTKRLIQSLDDCKNEECNPAELLGLRVVFNSAADLDADFPDPAFDLNSPIDPNESTAAGSEIQIHQKISLPDPNARDTARKRKPYLTWKEDLLGVKIINASYSNRVVTSKKHEFGTYQQKLASYDSDHHRWFISISDLIQKTEGYSPQDASLEDLQKVDLNLIMESGLSFLVQIQFQLTGPVPLIPVISTGAAPIHFNQNDFIRRISRDGWIVDTETIVNPGNRRQTLWVTAETQPGGLGLNTFLKYPVYPIHHHAPPGDPQWKAELSRGEFTINQVVAIHEDGQASVIALHPGDWNHIFLEPKETLRLQWIARPAAHVTPCALPHTTHQNASWMEPGPDQVTWNPFPHISEKQWKRQMRHGLFRIKRVKVTTPGAPQLRQRVLPIQWSFDGAEFAGTWNRRIRITHSYVLKEDAIRDHSIASNSNDPIEYHEIANGAAQVNLSIGTVHPGAPLAACQGIYR